MYIHRGNRRWERSIRPAKFFGIHTPLNAHAVVIREEYRIFDGKPIYAIQIVFESESFEV